MFQRQFIRRVFPIGACGAGILLCAAPAPGKDMVDRAACNASYKDYKTAKADEQSGRLREARDLYQSCSRAPCAGVAQRCTAKFAALNSDLPSVVPVVTDDAGEPRVDVDVKVDGQLVTSRLDGRGLPVEPGVHEFTFSADNRVFSTEKIMIIEGQHNRPIAVTIHSPNGKVAVKPAVAPSAPPSRQESPAPQEEPKAAPQEPAPDTTPPEKAVSEAAPSEETHKGGRSLFLPLVLGGVGLVGLGGGGLLTFWGRKDNSSLSQCSPSCSPSSLDHIRALYTAADISFGVGVASLGVATWLYLRSGSAEQKPAPKDAFTFDVHPIQAGAFASVKRAF
jgi:hypothetical protein